MLKLKIRLTRYEDAGWEFTVKGIDPFTGESTADRFRTNPVSDGLWQYVKSTTQWYGDGSPFWEFKQIEGTCQFSLPKERRAAYDKIRYRWSHE